MVGRRELVETACCGFSGDRVSSLDNFLEFFLPLRCNNVNKASWAIYLPQPRAFVFRSTVAPLKRSTKCHTKASIAPYSHFLILFYLFFIPKWFFALTILGTIKKKRWLCRSMNQLWFCIPGTGFDAVKLLQYRFPLHILFIDDINGTTCMFMHSVN
jgi:hypothetical protein